MGTEDAGRASGLDEVRRLYEDTADSYSRMMDSEIELPVYADVLGRLRDRIGGLAGPLLDSACGSGHMLALYHSRLDGTRPLLGVDLSPRMVAIASERLGTAARVTVGDMRALASVESGSCRAVLNFFALHHLDAEGAGRALDAFRRVLAVGGQLVVATWEGQGAIDYGGKSDIVALRYSPDEVASWARAAGFVVSRCEVQPVEDFPMDAVYLEGAKGVG